MENLQGLILKKEFDFKDLKQQLIKDLILSGIDSQYFEDINDAQMLIEKLQTFVSDLLSYHTADFDRFMYRVDINENKLSGLNHTNMSELIQNLCYLILIREMQKITFRKQFKA